MKHVEVSRHSVCLLIHRGGRIGPIGPALARPILLSHDPLPNAMFSGLAVPDLGRLLISSTS